MEARPVHPRLRRYASPEAAPHCPECGYNLYHLTGDCCPECGCEIGPETLVEGRWLSDDNAANRRRVAWERAAFWTGIGAGLIGTMLAVLHARLNNSVWASASGLVFTFCFGWGLMFQWGRGARAYPVVLAFGLLWLAINIYVHL